LENQSNNDSLISVETALESCFVVKKIPFQTFGYIKKKIHGASVLSLLHISADSQNSTSPPPGVLELPQPHRALVLLQCKLAAAFIRITAAPTG
jgi:hypothetical protein